MFEAKLIPCSYLVVLFLLLVPASFTVEKLARSSLVCIRFLKGPEASTQILEKQSKHCTKMDSS